MIADLKLYPSMKDSGVEWLGEVPEHWDVLPNRVLFGEVKERDHPEEPMLSVTITKGVIRQRELLANSSKKDSSNQDKSAYKLVRLGDIAYNKMRAWQGAIGVSDYQGIVSPAYVVERPRKGTSSRYLHYLLRTPAFAKEAERWSYGITSDMWSLRPEHFKMIYGCLPPLPEQAAIARFLDYADRRIQRYIRAKQKLITLLQEQKQALIQQAVTGQIDVRTGQPYPAYKPSGVEWLGDVPEHWEVRRLGTSVHGCINGIWGNDPNGREDLPCVRVADFDRVRLRVKLENPTLRAIAPNERNRRLLKRGDLLLEKSGGGNLQPVGVVILYDHDVEAVCSNFVALMLVSAHCDSSYLTYLHSHLYAIRLNVRSIKQTTGIQNLDSSSYLGEPVAFPPLAEQAAIARYLDHADRRILLSPEQIRGFRLALPSLAEQEKILEQLRPSIGSIRSAMNRALSQILLLREYHTRLIADVVTGKLDVREAASRLPDEVEEPEPLDEVEILINGEEEHSDDVATPEKAAV